MLQNLRYFLQHAGRAPAHQAIAVPQPLLCRCSELAEGPGSFGIHTEKQAENQPAMQLAVDPAAQAEVLELGERAYAEVSWLHGCHSRLPPCVSTFLRFQQVETSTSSLRKKEDTTYTT